jgi:hypothetical protein
VGDCGPVGSIERGIAGRESVRDGATLVVEVARAGNLAQRFPK